MSENNKISDKKTIYFFDDIVFEKRNKAYGAYDLRKRYKRNVLIAFIVSFIAIGSVVAVPLIDAYNNRNKNSGKKLTTVTAELEDLNKEDEAAPPPPPPPPPPPVDLVKQVQFAPPVVVDSAKNADFDLPEEKMDKPNDTPPPSLDEPEEKKDDVIEKPTPAFVKVEVNASFQGGTLTDFRNWVGTNMQYPEEALNMGHSGMVVVNFSISKKDGSVYNVNIMKSCGFPELDQEAIRIIQKSPKWIPARQGGEPVNQQYVLPVVFKLGE